MEARVGALQEDGKRIEKWGGFGRRVGSPPQLLPMWWFSKGLDLALEKVLS